MDLLERGRSLSELGRSLRWSDVRAMLLHLPASSHVRRVLAPEAARVAEWSTPQAQLLGALYDHFEVSGLLSRGVPQAELPKQGIISRVLNPEAQPAGEPESEPAPKPKKKTASEIRRMVG